MFDWNDLKYFIAVARCGSTIAAGKALGISQSTVQRRLIALEDSLGRQLVSRLPDGYQLTEFGKQLLPFADRVETAIVELEGRVKDETRDLSGSIRLTCPEPIIQRLIASKFLDRFHALHPKLRVEFVTSDRYLDLAKGEADVALRSGDTDDDLIGRKIADSVWAVYASRDYVARNGKPERAEDLQNHLLVAFDESLSGHRTAVWLKQVAPNARIAARNNSVLGLVAAIKSGIGVGPLPTALGDAEPDLERLFGPVLELTRTWKLLAHPDLRRTPRIAAFFEFLIENKLELKPILTG